MNLARQLRQELGADLDRAAFVALPRGGFFVLGFLSYLLNLQHSQIAWIDPPEEEIVVIVDDCALSGARFSWVLSRLTARHLVYAHLASPPELRRQILRREPRVRACLAAVDLEERGRGSEDEKIRFQREWRQRLGEDRYWLGAVEPLAFAWAEPDRQLWNEQKGEVEGGWNSLPPRACLRSRGELGLLPPDPPGPLSLAEGVFWKLSEKGVLLWRSDEDRCFGLEGTAVEFWRALMAFGDEERALAHLQRLFQVEPLRLAKDFEDFVQELRQRGLLSSSPA